MSSRDLLLIAHVGAAVLFLGPMTLATSRFAPAAERAADGGGLAEVASLHQVSRVYGLGGLAVPALGLALVAETSASLRAWWVWASLGLYVAMLALVLGVAVPAQARALHALHARPPAPVAPELPRLRAVSGVAAACWVVVLALMVTKPG